MNPYERARQLAIERANDMARQAGRTRWTPTDYQNYADEYLRQYEHAREQAQKAPETAVDPK